MKTERIQLTRNLFLDEYIPKELYRQFIGREHILVGKLDVRNVLADQMLRDYFGMVTMNNWWHEGSRNWSGIRTPGSEYYRPDSQHTYGRASDKIFTYASAEEVREYIKTQYLHLGITAIEDKVPWVHSDTRWTQSDNLLIFTP